MARKIIYWVITGLLAALSVFAAFTYLSGSPQAVQGFAHAGYPQQLRIILESPNSWAGSPSSHPACPDSRSGPMPDSPSPGSRHLWRIIWPKMAQRR